jgi:CxC2 like cysteine cluster associated with KDZ transposases
MYSKLIYLFAHLPAMQEWKNGFFQRTTLQSLGLCIQLGHPLGQSCPFRARAHQNFVVIHVNSIHVINLDFCACSNSPTPREQLLEVGWWPSTPLEPQSAASMTVLRSFHTWNLQGQISPTDFYRGLEQMTCGDGLSSVPVSICLYIPWDHHSNADIFKDHLAQWMLMVREWRRIKMTKRAGRGHDPTGIDGTSQGGLAIPCRACPQPDINLPIGWEDSLPENR